MTRALIVYSHPLTGSFTDATRNSVVSGLNSVGAEIRLADLYADGFDPCYSALDYANSRDGGIDRSLAGYVEDLAWCDTLILVYPTWWAGQPSMLTGWINRVWEGAAASGSSGATGHGLRPRSNVKRVVAVTSHGSSKLINMVEGEAGKRTLTRCLRSACHWRARTTWLALYAIDASTLAQREAFLRKVERRISTLA
jgi:putative NADPH-quinone reductase